MTKILVFGTFDILHKGHLDFFKQARRLAKHPYLIVSVARDVNVKKIKGQKPRHTENIRARGLKKLQMVDEIVLGDKTDYLTHIKKIRPDIIGLGYDQVAYTKNLVRGLLQTGLTTKVVRLKAYRPHVYKSSLIDKNVL